MVFLLRSVYDPDHGIYILQQALYAVYGMICTAYGCMEHDVPILGTKYSSQTHLGRLALWHIKLVYFVSNGLDPVQMTQALKQLTHWPMGDFHEILDD